MPRVQSNAEINIYIADMMMLIDIGLLCVVPDQGKRPIMDYYILVLSITVDSAATVKSKVDTKMLTC